MVFHLWVYKEEGFECAICKEFHKWEYSIPDPPERESWEKWGVVQSMTGAVPKLELYATGGSIRWLGPSNFPPVEKCEKGEVIEKLLRIASLLPNYGYMLSYEDWKRLEKDIPELLMAAIEADAILDNGLHSKVSFLSNLST